LDEREERGVVVGEGIEGKSREGRSITRRDVNEGRDVPFAMVELVE
jgi:hypothetical protein